MIYYISDIETLKECLDKSLSDYGTKLLTGIEYNLRNVPSLRVTTNQVNVYKKFLNSIVDTNQNSYPCYNPIESQVEFHRQDGITYTIYRTETDVKYLGQSIKVKTCDAPDATYSTIYSYDFSSVTFGGILTLVWYLNGVPRDIHTVTSVTDIVTWLEDYISKTAYDMVVAEDGTTVTITTNESTSVVGNLCLRNTALPPVSVCFSPTIRATKCYYTYKPKPICVNSCLSNCNISTLFSEISNYINNLNCMNC